MSSISVGKIIYETIKNNAEINSKVNNQIYPLVAQNQAKFPFIVYRRYNIDNENNKDKYNDIVFVEVVIASDKYEDSVAIAEMVRATLENTKGQINEFNVRKIQMIESMEDYIEDTFIQKINFKIDLNNGKL